MLQAEVADRLRARAGTRDYGVLTVLTALQADVVPLLHCRPARSGRRRRSRRRWCGCVFRPPPVDLRDRGCLHALVRVVFTQRRKTTATR